MYAFGGWRAWFEVSRRQRAPIEEAARQTSQRRRARRLLRQWRRLALAVATTRRRHHRRLREQGWEALAWRRERGGRAAALRRAALRLMVGRALGTWWSISAMASACRRLAATGSARHGAWQCSVALEAWQRRAARQRRGRAARRAARDAHRRWALAAGVAAWRRGARQQRARDVAARVAATLTVGLCVGRAWRAIAGAAEAVRLARLGRGALLRMVAGPRLLRWFDTTRRAGATADLGDACRRRVSLGRMARGLRRLCDVLGEEVRAARRLWGHAGLVRLSSAAALHVAAEVGAAVREREAAAAARAAARAEAAQRGYRRASLMAGGGASNVLSSKAAGGAAARAAAAVTAAAAAEERRQEAERRASTLRTQRRASAAAAPAARAAAAAAAAAGLTSGAAAAEAAEAAEALAARQGQAAAAALLGKASIFDARLLGGRARRGRAQTQGHAAAALWACGALGAALRRWRARASDGASSRGDRLGCDHIVGAWRCGYVAAAWAAWLAEAAAAARLHDRGVARRGRRRRLAQTLQTWRRRLKQRLDLGTLETATLRLWRSGALARAMRTWMTHSAAFAAGTAKLRGALTALLNQQLLGAIVHWREVAAAVSEAMATMRHVCQGLRHGEIFWGFALWRDLYVELRDTTKQRHRGRATQWRRHSPRVASVGRHALGPDSAARHATACGRGPVAPHTRMRTHAHAHAHARASPLAPPL